MNALDVMKYGHLTVLGSIDGLDEASWDTGGVCGVWSVKDIVAHLASYELLLADVLGSLADGRPAPRLDHYLESGPAFNDSEVVVRQHQTSFQTLDEYRSAYEAVADIAPRLSADQWRAPGTLPWYGSEYSLEDWIVYQFYGHKREHTAQIAVRRDRLSGAGAIADANG